MSTPAGPSNSAQFTAANSEYLSRPGDDVSLSTGDIDFWMAGWVWLDTKTAFPQIATKSDQVNQAEYVLAYRQDNDRFYFQVFPTGTGGGVLLDATSGGAVSTGNWYFLLAWHDSVNDVIRIRVNNGATDSAASAAGVLDTTAAFRLGTRYSTPELFWDGRIDQFAFGKNPVGGVDGLISTISTRLYNSGAGIRYADLTGAEKTDWGLVSFWELEEATGQRDDSHGTNHLTDINTVTQADGVV